MSNKVAMNFPRTKKDPSLNFTRLGDFCTFIHPFLYTSILCHNFCEIEKLEKMHVEHAYSSTV